MGGDGTLLGMFVAAASHINLPRQSSHCAASVDSKTQHTGVVRKAPVMVIRRVVRLRRAFNGFGPVKGVTRLSVVHLLPVTLHCGVNTPQFAVDNTGHVNFFTDWSWAVWMKLHIPIFLQE